jgi:hypothetical protein
VSQLSVKTTTSSWRDEIVIVVLNLGHPLITLLKGETKASIRVWEKLGPLQ